MHVPTTLTALTALMGLTNGLPIMPTMVPDVELAASTHFPALVPGPFILRREVAASTASGLEKRDFGNGCDVHWFSGNRFCTPEHPRREVVELGGDLTDEEESRLVGGEKVDTHHTPLPPKGEGEGEVADEEVVEGAVVAGEAVEGLTKRMELGDVLSCWPRGLARGEMWMELPLCGETVGKMVGKIGDEDVEREVVKEVVEMGLLDGPGLGPMPVLPAAAQ